MKPIINYLIITLLTLILACLVWIGFLLNKQPASDNPVRYHGLYINHYRQLASELATTQEDDCNKLNEIFKRQAALVRQARDNHGVDIRTIPDLVPDIEQVNDRYGQIQGICELDPNSLPIQSPFGEFF